MIQQLIPIVLIAFGGFLIGGVVAFRKRSVPIAVVFAIFAVACVLGGVLWLISVS